MRVKKKSTLGGRGHEIEDGCAIWRMIPAEASSN